MSDRPFPSPEEIQRKLSEFLKKEFGNDVSLAAAQAEPVQTHEVGDEVKRKKFEFAFNYKPKDIKAYLDRFVIQQEDAKKVLSIAVCDHYNHVKQVENGDETPDYIKQNIIMLGPTGVGKTYLIRCIADLIGVPFVKADATKFSETGYVGGDVEDLVRELVHRADGNIQLARYGIIYLDEVDKIAAPPNIIGRDVSGRGVQTNLLKLMEETEVPLRSPMDIQAQLQAAMEFQRRGKVKRETVNTRHILFIVSGAFDAMLDIIRRRLRETQIGFGAHLAENISDSELLRKAATEDFIKFGFEPEFIGRLPVRVVLDPLSVDDLYEILAHSEGSVLKQYEASFRAFGIEALFSEDGMRAIAELAAVEKTGARGLLTVCERVLRDFKYELPGSNIRHLVVTRELVTNPRAELQRILTEPMHEQRVLMRQMAREFEKRFEAKHKFRIHFTNDAVEELIERAQREQKSVPDLCAELLKDFHFGLNLIKANTGQTEIVVPREALADPDKWLSDAVVKSYRKE
jgi:ATP-dependent Clp protease ATP-binding subunit ClpX